VGGVENELQGSDKVALANLALVNDDDAPRRFDPKLRKKNCEFTILAREVHTFAFPFS
jgi:hypothetical protein